MLQDALLFFSSIWQEQPAAFAFYLAGKTVWETLMLLLISTSIGATILYFFPEEINLMIKIIKKILFSSKKQTSQESKIKIFFLNLNSRLHNHRSYLIEKLAKNGYPKIAIFIVTVIPIPGLLLVAIATARLLNLKHGYYLILIGSVVRTLVLVTTIYRLGQF